MRTWHRTRAAIRRMPSRGVSPENSLSHPSPAASLPQEIVEMVVAYLAYDTRSLWACRQTCCSWHIATAPHLHNTLFTPIIQGGAPWWPDSFQKMHKLGLFPLVKRFQVGSASACDFSLDLFDRQILHQFSSLTNVRELGIENLDIPSFMPRIRRYFKHFLPTVRSLALTDPIGSRRQITFFIGLFQHLEDLKLLSDSYFIFGEIPGDLSLVPPFTPPLRGWLTIWCRGWVGILEDIAGLFGGLRFRHMDLRGVTRGMQSLLIACAETLETLRFDLFDPRGQVFLWKGCGSFN